MHALVSTRKGLFELSRSQNVWSVGKIHFLGDPITMTLHDPRDGTTYAALNLGHFGVKLHRRDSGAGSWTEIAVPTYPQQPEGCTDEHAWKLVQIWSMACGGADEPGVLWAGTLPGGLFRSNDRGDSWELVRSLWDQPSRPEWQGGGYDTPGLHSICVDPRDSKHILVAISSGGVWITRDGGASWTASTKGMRATYMPEERMEDPFVQDPHRIVQSPSSPDVYWCQHHCGIWHSIDGGAHWNQCKPEGRAPAISVLWWQRIRIKRTQLGSCRRLVTRGASRSMPPCRSRVPGMAAKLSNPCAAACRKSSVTTWSTATASTWPTMAKRS